MFATYVHDLNPVLLRITDAIQLRWYGLAYLAGFVGGFLLLRHLARGRLGLALFGHGELEPARDRGPVLLECDALADSRRWLARLGLDAPRLQ